MDQDRTKPYRCLIPADDCICHIRLGSKDKVCEIVDLSREDFRVLVPKGFEKTLRNAKRIELLYHGERWLVKFNRREKGGEVDTVILDRLQELTPMKLPSPWTTLFSLRMSRDTDPRFVLAVMLAFIAVCISLPGIGDKLGTAPKIKNGVQNVIRSFN